jgi:hypothetical protein
VDIEGWRQDFVGRQAIISGVDEFVACLRNEKQVEVVGMLLAEEYCDVI